MDNFLIKEGEFLYIHTGEYDSYRRTCFKVLWDFYSQGILEEFVEIFPEQRKWFDSEKFIWYLINEKIIEEVTASNLYLHTDKPEHCYHYPHLTNYYQLKT